MYNKKMINVEFYKTEDNTTGIYSGEYSDIFHSKTGALREAKEKFIYPILDFVNNTGEKLNVLDICYGTGYNSKALLEFTRGNFDISCLEYEKDFALLSPFINDGINNHDLKVFLLGEVFKSEIYNVDSICLIEDYVKRHGVEFFDASMINLINLFINYAYKSNKPTQNNSILHNIYYKYISNEYNSSINLNKYKDSSFDFYFEDARMSLVNINKMFDIVFLDAFSPQKSPILWTIDFLSLVKSKMNKNSVLVSYSKSTPFRSSLVELGFFVGKTFIDNVDMGTIASFNKNNIKNFLDDHDLNLIKTRSGIPYRDKLLCLDSSDIINNRILEMNSSCRISHTQYLKLINK